MLGPALRSPAILLLLIAAGCSQEKAPVMEVHPLDEVIAQLVDEITTIPDEPLPEWVIGPFRRGEVNGEEMVFRPDLNWRGPTDDEDWHATAVWNPSLIEKDGRLYLFYRAGPSLEGLDSRIALAWSDDGGITWTDYERNPIIYPTEEYESRSIEDPAVYEHNGTYYLYYKAVEDGPDGGVFVDIALATSDDLLNWEKRGRIVPRSVTGGWAKGPVIARSPAGEAVQIDGAFIMYLSELPMVSDTDAGEQMIGRSTDLVNWTFEQTPYLDPAENEEISSIYEVATAVVIPNSDDLVLDFYYTEPDGGYGCGQALYSVKNPTEQLEFSDYGVCTWGGFIEYGGRWLMAHGWEEAEAIHVYSAPVDEFDAAEE